MGYYLLDHPNPNTPQCRTPRRAQLSGTVGVHTAEGALDAIAPDSGAENVANFIANRRDYGSYHELHDSDSVVLLAPDNYETWHIGESDAYGMGMNSHSWGVSAACRSTEWNPDDPWTRTVIASMGASIRAFWLRNGFDPNECARWLTRDQAKQRMPGLVHHGVVQPSDRSDAWVKHPRRPELDAMLVAAIVGAEPEPDPQPEPPQEADVPTAIRYSDANTVGAVHTFQTDREGHYWFYEGRPAELAAQGIEPITIPDPAHPELGEMWERYPVVNGPMARGPLDSE